MLPFVAAAAPLETEHSSLNRFDLKKIMNLILQRTILSDDDEEDEEDEDLHLDLAPDSKVKKFSVSWFQNPEVSTWAKQNNLSFIHYELRQVLP